MKAEYIKSKGTWRDVADSANETIGKDAGHTEPPTSWKKRMLLCEHSPIRTIVLVLRWENLKYWLSVHFSRHWLGILHFVKTQRTDRTGTPRDLLPQESPVNHRIEANQQALINISRKRLCHSAGSETIAAWEQILDTIKLEHPELYSVCVPDCIYRGYCYEYKPCGYSYTEAFTNRLAQYRNINRI
jgi:hypothetical protein